MTDRVINRHMTGMSFWRAAFLLALSLLLPSVARAITPVPAPPIWQSVDANGVDMSRGYAVISSTDVSIGSGVGAIAYSRTWVDAGWRDSLSATISGSSGNAARMFIICPHLHCEYDGWSRFRDGGGVSHSARVRPYLQA